MSQPTVAPSERVQPVAVDPLVPSPAAACTGALRLAVAGGGTGGHIVPGLHLLEHLGERKAELSSLVWFHSGRPVEERVMEGFDQRFPGARVEAVRLDLERQGGGAPRLSRLATRLTPAVWRARGALRRQRVQALLGLGGLTTAPAVLAARSLGIPVALLEVNATAGRAIRALSPFAHLVFHAWPSTLPRDPGAKHLLTGPPLASPFHPPEARDGDRTLERARMKQGFGFDPQRPLVVVFGGSQGAKGLNEFMRAHQTALCAAGVQILHQVGPGRTDESAAELAGYRVLEYVRDVPAALTAADVVLCRGGASTLAEVAAMRTPAWVVPYPYHSDAHQERNAEQLGAGARIVREEDLGVRCREELVHLVGPDGAPERARMACALADAVPLDASMRILDGLLAMRK